MQIPDVAGYALDDALELLKASGVQTVSVCMTAPPARRGGEYDGNSRVIRQTRPDEGNLVLLVCKMDDYISCEKGL